LIKRIYLLVVKLMYLLQTNSATSTYGKE